MDDTETIAHFELTQYAKQTQLSQIFDERHTNWNLARQEHSESYVQNTNHGQTFYSEKMDVQTCHVETRMMVLCLEHSRHFQETWKEGMITNLPFPTPNMCWCHGKIKIYWYSSEHFQKIKNHPWTPLGYLKRYKLILISMKKIWLKRLKPLPHKHEDQSLDSQNPHKCQKGVMAHL